VSVDWIRKTCMGLPRVTEHVQWGNDLVFKIGGKIFVVAPFEPPGNYISFKCSDEDYAELIERPGIIPAPYLARAHWVAIETEDVMGRRELGERLKKAYELVLASLTKKARAQLGS
jgi:predicted DNA-binding protein (MmcQ/YjbR family)